MAELAADPSPSKRARVRQAASSVEAWDEAQCLAWLDELATSSGPLLQNICLAARAASAEVGGSVLSGKGLLAATRSTRELRDTFGLHSVEARCAFERAVVREKSKLQLAAPAALCPGALTGGPYSEVWRDAVRPLYSMHMGTEHMAPLLYALVRFLKPQQLLEVGAGYTSIFLLQALRDNAEELAEFRCLRQKAPVRCGETPWLLDEFFADERQPDGRPCPEATKLRCVDDLTHPETTAHKLREVASELELLPWLSLEVADAWRFGERLAESGGECLDFVWIDFGARSRLDEFFELYWPRVRQGGHVLVHSTLTNRLARTWLESMRTRSELGGGKLGEFATFSMLEPHKLFQNSFSIFQKRGEGYAEPLHTDFA
eukprot:TRINITY_DN8553_c0_g1_i2.p1 TRINITY_DN8553_c0_g1~~TRINITY_DN8553_c0_g1_i2.p1  ORF type:complete len:375 (+),score=68.80 TRINITY_DN8553_c0_g1_i2:27-1151(+)